MHDGIDEIAGPPPIKAQARPSGGDLSGEIERSVGKEPLDRVRCARVFDDFYRCNWWAPSAVSPSPQVALDWAALATHRVRRSRFLCATVSAGQLVIKEVER